MPIQRNIGPRSVRTAVYGNLYREISDQGLSGPQYIWVRTEKYRTEVCLDRNISRSVQRNIVPRSVRTAVYGGLHRPNKQGYYNVFILYGIRISSHTFLYDNVCDKICIASEDETYLPRVVSLTRCRPSVVSTKLYSD